MLARCCTSTMAANGTTAGVTPNNQAATGATTTEDIDATDEIRVPATIAAHTTAQTRKAGHASTTQTPAAVANPLPPRNPSQTGKQWPTTAATAAQTQIGPAVSQQQLNQRRGQHDRHRALPRVEQHSRRRKPFAAGPQNVGRANAAAADLADVALAGGLRQQQAKRN